MDLLKRKERSAVEATLVILGAVLLVGSFPAHIAYAGKVRGYRERVLTTTSRAVDDIYRMKRQMSKEKYLADLSKVLYRYSREIGYSKAPRNLLFTLIGWGSLSVSVGLTWGTLPGWVSELVLAAVFMLGVLFAITIPGIMRVGEE